MSTKPKHVEEETRQVVATAPAGLPPALAARMAEDAGKGTSQASEDNIIPLVYILQAQSPQVLARNPKYVKDAVASSIWLRNAPQEIVDGERGMLFQPCYFDKVWNEWKPRDDGGGFIGRHVALPADAVKAVDPVNPNKVRYTLPNGNEVIETRQHYGYVIAGELGLDKQPPGAWPFVISMSGTGHTSSRTWMQQQTQHIVPQTNKPYPAWARLYVLRTQARKNAAGEWFGWSFSDGGWVTTEEAYMRGLAMNTALLAGTLRAGEEVAGANDGGDGQTIEGSAEAAGV